MRVSYLQHGGWAAALKFIESGERAAIDYIPKIKEWVFTAKISKREFSHSFERPCSAASRP
jgi:hypothetical protein